MPPTKIGGIYYFMPLTTLIKLKDNNMEQIINNSMSVANFSKNYPILNKYLMESGSSVESRNGSTKEILNFKTEITNPHLRCVGGFGRDMNIFFLLAEALWIFAGRKDVAYLKIFNEKMGDYSDDGESFHAPYGFRLRHHGLYSFDKLVEERMHSGQGIDQIHLAIKMLEMNPDDRRVVMQIWNADYDLASTSRDLPCNDLVMLKIREGKLHTTISNRSNDLHWGLPTNIFQFGTISELIALTLGVKLGTQVHNSQSLHYYLENDIAWKLYENYQMLAKDEDRVENDLYSVAIGVMPIDYDFAGLKTAIEKLEKLDLTINRILQKSIQPFELMFNDDLFQKSKYLFLVYNLLIIYTEYKKKGANDEARISALMQIIGLGKHLKVPNCDLIVMAENFFVKRLKNQTAETFNLDRRIGKL